LGGWPIDAEAEPVCNRVQADIDRFARAPPEDSGVLRRLAPYMGSRATKDLMQHVGRPDPGWRYNLYLAVGMTRQSEALQALSTHPPTEAGLPVLGHALGLLALGDGTGTPTIAAALSNPSVDRRRRVSRALSRMRHNRPLTMLWDVINDDDPEVQLYAARGLIPSGSRRARRALRKLARDGPPSIRRMAAQALLEADLRFPPAVLAALPDPVRAQAMAAEAARGRRAVIRRLPSDLLSSDPQRRSGAFAGLAHRESPARLQVLARRALRKYGADAEAELLMAKALTGDTKAATHLLAVDGAGVQRALGVLWAFAGAGSERARIDEDTAAAIAKVIAHWMATNALDPRGTSQVIRALETLDPLTSLSVARRRLAGPDDWGLRTALRVMARHGGSHDVPQLYELSRRLDSTRTRVEALRAAARICRR